MSDALEMPKELALKGFQCIVEQANFDAFEYHLDSGEIRIYNARHNLCQRLLEILPQEMDFSAPIIANELIYPEDQQLFRDAFSTLYKGNKNAVCEFRMKVTELSYAWVRLTLTAKQAERWVMVTLEDITYQKEMALQYLNKTQFYQAMLSEKAAFAQVDVTADCCTRFGGMWNLYNEIINTVTYSELIEEFINKVVHPEDRKHYLELMQRDNFFSSLKNGVNKLGCEFRRIVEQNKMMWMELHVHLFWEPFTHHVLALVYLTNIDARKKQELALLHDSERDHLTNTFNKKIVENSIRDYLKNIHENEICAFIILDMDNFKFINDTYGHSVGDQVLIRLVEILRNTFYRNDIIGRFGGDEFILFLKDIGSKEKVCAQLDNLYRHLQMEKNPVISCSIGVALISQGNTYEQFFRQADIALYSAKRNGKGQYVFFHHEIPLEHNIPAVIKYSERSTDLLIPEPVEEISFDTFLAEQGDLAYLIDPDTFTLICGNKAFFDRIGMTATECIGIKCYEAMQKRKKPCPFCSKANWATDKFYLWRTLNAVLEQEFLMKNKLVQWRGKEALLTIAVDISNDKSIVDSMENQATESRCILSGVQQMSEAPTLSAVISNALETIGYFFGAHAVYFWEKRKPQGPYHRTSCWIRTKPESTIQEYDISGWLQERNWDKPILIECPEAMLCDSYTMYQYMKKNHINNQRWVQLRDGAQEIGCIVAENISINFQNVAFLESFTVFVTNEIKKRRLMERILYSNTCEDLT